MTFGRFEHPRRRREKALQELPFLLMAMALTAGAALSLCFQHWKAQRIDPRRPHQKARRLNPGLLRRMTQRVDPEIEHEFNKVFMFASKEGKEALIKGWRDRKKCSRGEAMRLAVEEWRWQ
jgi:hypothetical protein